MDTFVVVSEPGLNGVGRQQHGCLWGTVDLIGEDGLLHLHEEELLRDVLDQLLCNILWEELCKKPKLKRVLLFNFLCRHL